MPHHHGRHYGHHHHQSSGAGLALGMLAVGALAGAAVSSASQPSYYRPPSPTVYIYETPEQIAARRKADEDRRAELERQRQERLAEQERQRKAIAEREDREEEQRCNHYKQHENVIRSARFNHANILQQQIQQLPLLVEPIARFSASPYKNIPEVDGWNLLAVVAYRLDIEERVKCQLIQTLIDRKGYGKWSTYLFTDPLHTKLLETQSGYQLLRDIYMRSFVNTKILLPEMERRFLQHCLRQPTENPLFLYNSIRNRDSKFQLIVDWISLQRRATDVMHVYETISSREFGLNQVYLRRFLKIAKQKILMMEISQASALHPDEDMDRIREFLDIHRGTWTSCISCFFSRRSTEIHSMIASGQIYRANEAVQVEERAIRRDFYRRHHLI